MGAPGWMGRVEMLSWGHTHIYDRLLGGSLIYISFKRKQSYLNESVIKADIGKTSIWLENVNLCGAQSTWEVTRSLNDSLVQSRFSVGKTGREAKSSGCYGGSARATMHLGAGAKCHSNLFTGKPSALFTACLFLGQALRCLSLSSSFQLPIYTSAAFRREKKCVRTLLAGKQYLRRVTRLPVTTTKLLRLTSKERQWTT